jgi:adenine-specific DNA-methyltransferase
MQLIENTSKQKLRGAYYTPPAIADFILRWGIKGNNDADIFEPSCGDGVFIECIAKGNMPFHSVTAVEYEKAEAEKARAINLHDTEVINTDFHSFCLNTAKRFDIVVGNPPFIRYQYYDESQQQLADVIFKRSQLKRTKLTNAWVTFVVGSCQLLKRNGKMGFVIPSELLMVKYAQQLRKFLAQTFNKINIISFENLVFEEIQQEVILLLCEKNETNEHHIEHIEVRDTDDLLKLDPQRLKFPAKKIDFHMDKWTYYFLEKEELDFLGEIKSADMPIIANYADVEVGITTGSNDFFTVPQSIVTLYQLQEYACPMVGRSVQVNSLCFTSNDWKNNVETGAKAHLLVFPPKTKDAFNEGTQAYIEYGEYNKINKGYKTSIRDYWYVIPSIKLSDALFLRRNNQYPKFVLNEAEAYTTDTMHRVFINEGVNKKAFVASYYNSLSFAFAEILGRNFGGGCLELMPSEVRDIYLPYNESNKDLFDRIDFMLRHNATADEILDVTDDVILHQRMHLSKKDVALARSIWHKIMSRRLNRGSLEKKKNVKETEQKVKYQQLSFLDLFDRYALDNITENSIVHDAKCPQYEKEHVVDINKNVLVSLVKKDNEKIFLDGSATIYYTGKKFPTTVALNKLYYFMPYIKGKGVRDLFLIKIARLGYRKEGTAEEDKNDLRLVFEIEYVGKLFDNYKKVKLEIWRTFTDTTISKIQNEPVNGPVSEPVNERQQA